MARNEPLFGDIKAKRGASQNIGSDIAWSALLEGVEGGQGGAYGGYIPGLDPADYTEEGGHPMYYQSDFANWGQTNPNSTIDFGSVAIGYDQAQNILNNPAFATYYNQFADQSAGAGAPAHWWNQYGKYFKGLDKPGISEAITKRKGAIETEELRMKALDNIEKTGGFAGKRGFAGDSGLIKARKSMQEEAIRRSDLSKLGVESSLWDVHQNYMSNMYDQFAALAGVGAFED
tara:strand:- start:19631 stop:20326 length:696 start_codon:yes stop_codon:yes gene_type:complete